MVTLIGFLCRIERKSVCAKSAKNEWKFAQRIVQRWPAACLPLHVTISGTLAVTMNKWMAGVVKILKCRSEFGNAAEQLRRFPVHESDMFSVIFIPTSESSMAVDFDMISD